MTSWEFAQAMDISYHTAMRWLKFGIVPGAVKAENNRDWIVPESALKMKRPVPGPKPDAGIVRTRAESAQIAKLRTEIELQKNEIGGLQKMLNDKNEAITEICEDLKSLQGECRSLQDIVEREKACVMGQHLIIDRLKETIRSREDEVDTLRLRCERLETEAKSAEDTIAYKDREIDKVWEKVRGHQEEITNLSEDINGKQLIIDNLNEECRRQQEEITRLKGREGLDWSR